MSVLVNFIAWTPSQRQGSICGPGLNFIRRAFTPAIIAAEKLTATTVRVDFNDLLRSYSPTSVAGNYTITGPSTVTVSSVAFTPGNSYAVLTVTGTFAPGTYTVAVAGNTVQSAADDRIVNASGSCSLVVDTVILFFAAKMIGGQIRVDFGQALRSLAATTVAGNYTFTGPGTLTTASVVFTPGNSYVLLNVNEAFQTGDYTLTVAANTVEMAALDIFNGSGSSIFEVDVIDDRTPPTVNLISPLTGQLDQFTEAVLEVTDTGGFSLINISIALPTGEEVVFRNGAFTPAYIQSARAVITNGFRFTVVRKLGWPVGTVLQFNVDAVDASGNKV